MRLLLHCMACDEPILTRPVALGWAPADDADLVVLGWVGPSHKQRAAAVAAARIAHRGGVICKQRSSTAACCVPCMPAGFSGSRATHCFCQAGPSMHRLTRSTDHRIGGEVERQYIGWRQLQHSDAALALLDAEQCLLELQRTQECKPHWVPFSSPQAVLSRALAGNSVGERTWYRQQTHARRWCSRHGETCLLEFLRKGCTRRRDSWICQAAPANHGHLGADRDGQGRLPCSRDGRPGGQSHTGNAGAAHPISAAGRTGLGSPGHATTQYSEGMPYVRCPRA